MSKILVIDNYDSFAINLARHLTLLDNDCEIVRNDKITLEQIEDLAPKAIVLSPGPCTPHDAGISLACIRHFYNRYPILGICLGHQAIAEAFGGNIIRATTPMHGMSSKISHMGNGIFGQIPDAITVGRYHSLIVCEDTLPKELKITARCPDRQIMALEHERYPVVGLQFHPESIMTEYAFVMLENFLKSIKHL